MTDAPAVEKAPQEPVAADAPLAPAAPTEPKPTTEAPVAEKPVEAVPATADQEVPQLGTNGTPSTQADTAKPVTEASEAYGPGPQTPDSASGSKLAANGEVKAIETNDTAEETHRMEQDTGDKRKADDTTDVNGLKGSTNGAASEKGPEAAERAGKKQKTNGASEPAPATTARKPRGGKKKKPLAPVGRTARKTRSQGPVEV